MKGSVDALLTLSGLGYAYDGRPALSDVGFEVRKGEVLGLLGPNGAGKTTAIGCIAGLLAPAAGSLSFDGRPFDPRRNAADRGLLGYVPQELAVYDELSARENLSFFAELCGVDDVDGAVQRGLALSGLSPRADERVKKFSGGMKRRLNIAVATLHEPRLLLLDEPTVGVDPQSRHHIFEFIEALAGSGRSLLYTSHAMDEVERLCDRIVLMDGGRVLAHGTREELAALSGAPDADLEATFLALTGRGLRDG